MKRITKTQDLAAFCEEAAWHAYVTVDTEFLRERTYYSKLCLIQLAMPGDTNDTAVLVDPLSDGLSLEPLYKLFRDTSVVKVFHAARQDLEIFFVDAQVFPEPLFDTQVAAMVCGFGDEVTALAGVAWHLGGSTGGVLCAEGSSAAAEAEIEDRGDSLRLARFQRGMGTL